MTLTDRIRALVEAGDPQGTVTIAWLSEQLRADGATLEPAADAGVQVDLTVRQVADLFGRGVSTVRMWLTADAFPNAYRLQGKEWRVPRADIEAMQRRQREHARPARPNAGALPADSVNIGDWRKHAPGGKRAAR